MHGENGLVNIILNHVYAEDVWPATFFIFSQNFYNTVDQLYFLKFKKSYDFPIKCIKFKNNTEVY